MDWFSIDINVENTEIKDILTSYAFDLGAGGVEDLTETFFYNEKKESEGLRLFFDKNYDKNEIIDSIKKYIISLGIEIDGLKFLTEEIEKQNWREKWKESYTPQIAGSFVVLPEWMRDNVVKEDQIKIMISPKMAFGTGTHETTQLMLTILSGMDLKDKTILDAGCGSGILSIGAVKLGAKKIIGVDIDEESIDNSTENAGLNQVKDKITVEFTEDSVYNAKYDIVIANINRAVLIDLFDKFYNSAKEMILLSGILADEKEIMFNKVKEYKDLELVDYKEKNEWCCMLLKRS